MKAIVVLALVTALVACNEENTTITNKLPSVIDVSAPGGTYGIGKSFNITVTFSESVVVSGTPQLFFTSDGKNRTVDYVSGSNSNELIFRYTVVPGDSDGHAIEVTEIDVDDIIDLEGGQANQYTTNKLLPNVTIDGIAPQPTVTGEDNVYQVDQIVRIRVTFDEQVRISGTPHIDLTVDTASGPATRRADYTTDSGSAALIFLYTVRENDRDNDGIQIARFNFDTGTIEDVAGNRPDITINKTLPEVKLRGSQTGINHINVTDGHYKATDAIAITLVYSEAVTVNTDGGKPQLQLVVGSNSAVTAGYDETNTSGTHVAFSYIVGTGDTDTDGIQLTELTLNGATITDSSGENSNNIITSDAGNRTGVLIDTTAPAISAITAPAGTYTTDNTIDIRVHYSEDVTVTGAPQLTLTVGDTDKTADYIPDGDSATLMFRYKVTEDDRDADGIAVTALHINEGTIRDSASNDADTGIHIRNPALTTTVIYQPNTPAFASQGVLATYGDTDVSNDATCIAGNAPDYTTDDSTQLILNAATGTYTIRAVGDTRATVTAICATDSATGYYEQTASYEIHISKAPLSLSFEIGTSQFDLTYDSTTPTDGSALVYTGLVNGDSDQDIIASGATLTYSSSDTTKITVHATGQLEVTDKVTANNIGDTFDIQVSLTDAANYIANETASYTVRLVDAIVFPNATADYIPFSAWLSSTGAQLIFPANVSGNYDLYSSREPDCDINNYRECTEGQLKILDRFPVSAMTSAWTLDTPAYYVLQGTDNDTGNNKTARKTVPSTHIFAARSNHQVLVFNNRLYLIGGIDGVNYKNDVWYSDDGIIWTEATPDAAFSARFDHQVVVFNNKMYLIGGDDGSSRKNDIWSSTDGINWIEETADAAFPARYKHQIVVLHDQIAQTSATHPEDHKETIALHDQSKDYMYLIGGVSDNGYENDVWRSDDGIHWTEMTPNAAFSARFDHQVTVFNNRMYLIGGFNIGGRRHDIWSSTDGIDWTEDTPDPAFSARFEHQVVVFNNKMYLIGGYDENHKNDVWSSSNGIDWTQDALKTAFSPRQRHQVVAFNNKMYLIGGYDEDYKNDIWYSTDGTVWTMNTANTAFSARQRHQVVVFNNKMYLIGGYDDSNRQQDIWSSGNGIVWTELTSNAAFPARSNHQVVVFNDRMYLIGGFTGSSQNDIWRSDDGIDWTELTSDAAFPARTGYQVVVFNDRMYLIGGIAGSNYKNDVWSSSNGIDWTQDVSNAPFSGRYYHQVIVFNDKMYLIGGLDSGGDKNDIWSSTDGIHWTRDIPNAAFFARFDHQVVVLKDKMYLIGGIAGSRQDDVWSSTDGSIWTEDTSHTPFSARSGHQVITFNNRIYLIGGSDGNNKNDVWRSSDGKNWAWGVTSTFIFE